MIAVVSLRLLFLIFNRLLGWLLLLSDLSVPETRLTPADLPAAAPAEARHDPPVVLGDLPDVTLPAGNSSDVADFRRRHGRHVRSVKEITSLGQARGPGHPAPGTRGGAPCTWYR